MDYFDQLETRLAELTTAGAHLRRRRGPHLGWLRSPLPALALGVSIVVVAAVVAIALSTRSGSPSPQPAHQPMPSAISPVLVRNFRILRRPVRPSDALPAAYARLGVDRSFGVVPQLARRAVLPGTRLETWLEPGRSGFCVYIAERLPSGAARTRGFASSCSSAVNAVPPEVGAVQFSTNGPALLRGIVPDNVSWLVLAPAHGKPLEVRPTEGFFAVAYRPGDRLYAGGHGEADQIFPLAAPQPPLANLLTPRITILSSKLPNGSRFKLMIQRVEFRAGASACFSYAQQFGRGSAISQSCVRPGSRQLAPLEALETGPTSCGRHPAQVVWGVAPTKLRVQLRFGGVAQATTRLKLKTASEMGLRGDVFYVVARSFPDTLVALAPNGHVERSYAIGAPRGPAPCRWHL